MDLALGTDGDLDLTTGGLAMVDGDDAIVQHCAFRLRYVRGECFLYPTHGTPYFEQILVKNPDLVAVRQVLRRVILETPGIGEVANFVLTLDSATRRATVTFEAKKADNPDGTPLVFKEFVILKGAA